MSKIFEVWFDPCIYSECVMECFSTLEDAKEFVKQLRKEKRPIIKSGRKCSISIDLLEVEEIGKINFIKTVYHKEYNYKK